MQVIPALNHVTRTIARLRAQAIAALCAPLLAACSGPVAQRALPLYRCEYGIEFTARFIDNSVALDGSRGRDVLYKKQGGKPGEYDNPRMSAEFDLGPTQREAVLRYPLLPLVARCVRD
jgi:hypothetical protein